MARPVKNFTLHAVDLDKATAHKVATFHTPKALDWKYVHRAIRTLSEGYPVSTKFALTAGRDRRIIMSYGYQSVGTSWVFARAPHTVEDQIRAVFSR